MKLNKKKIYFCKNLPKLFTLFIFLISLKGNFLTVDSLAEELQIDNSTKTQEESSVIPTNPFELVEMIRRRNSLNDATNPSDAIDDALESFNSFEEKQEI